MYQLFCDSNCELWHTTVKDLGINLIRMPYLLNDEEHFYDMGENTDLKAFFDAFYPVHLLALYLIRFLL